MRFIKATIAGGFFVILPVVLIWMLIEETIGIVDGLTAPIVEKLPVDKLGGLSIATLLAVVLIVLACFITGVLMRTAPVARIGGWLERTLLHPIPGYTLVKALTQRFAGTTDDSRFAPAFIHLAPGYHEIGFIVERHSTGYFTVFIPLAPTPAVGTIRVVAAELVQPIDAPMGVVANSLLQWGIGSADLPAPEERAAAER